MITIEPFTPSLQTAVADLILHIQANEFGIPITLADQPDLMHIPDFYQKNAGNFWLALKDERVVGTVALLDIGNSQGALRKMFVDQEFRGKELAVASQLLQTLLDAAQKKFLTEIYLGTTAQFQAAHRFYEKHAFLEVPRESLPPAFPQMKIDTKFYRKQF